MRFHIATAFVLCALLCSHTEAATKAVRLDASQVDAYLVKPIAVTEPGIETDRLERTKRENEHYWKLKAVRRLGKPGGMYTNTLLVGDFRRPLIFFYDPEERTLQAVFCHDATCKKTSTAKIGKGGRSNAAVVGNDGLPFVAFCQEGRDNSKTADRLMGFKCSTPHCSASGRDDGYAIGTEMVLDADGCGLYTAATSNEDGHPVIAYYRHNPFSTWIVVCHDFHCRSHTRNPLKMMKYHGIVDGSYPGIAIHAGLPVISASWSRAGDSSSVPALFFCSDALCKDPVSSSNAIIFAPPAAWPIVPGRSSKIMDIRYTALSSYSKDISVLYFDAERGAAVVATVMNALQNSTCASDLCARRVQVSLIDADIGDVYGEFPHIARNPLNHWYPVVAYTRQVSKTRGDLMLVTCQNQDCSSFTRKRLGTGKCGFGRDTSVAIDSGTGYAYISFMDYNPVSSKRSARIAVLKSSNIAGTDEHGSKQVKWYHAQGVPTNHGNLLLDAEDNELSSFKDIC